VWRLLSLTVRFFRWIDQYAVNVLSWDQWDLAGSYFPKDVSLWKLFVVQHGPHRMGIGIIFEKLFFDATAWNTRAEAFALGVVVVFALGAALYLKRRLFGSWNAWDFVLPLMFFTPQQYEVFVGTIIPSHGAFPLLLVFLYCLAWTLRKEPIRYIVLSLANFCLIYTGFGIFMGFVTPALLLIDIYDRLRRVGRPLWPVVALAVSLGSLGSFFLGYRFAPAVDCFRFPHPDLSAYPKFIGLMMVSYLGLRGRGWEPWSWSTGWLRMVGG
jgi:hypothetical protein